MPERSERYLSLVHSAAAEPACAGRYLRRRLPDSWRFAQQMAADLVRQLEHLAWDGRAEILDAYLLRQADAMLPPHGLSELIGGSGRLPAVEIGVSTLEPQVEQFVRWSRAIIVAVLLKLDEPGEVTGAEHALTYLLAGDRRFAKAAGRWATSHGVAPIRTQLRDLPGYALVLLAGSPNDTAERFMARDAFWTAVMARI